MESISFLIQTLSDRGCHKVGLWEGMSGENKVIKPTLPILNIESRRQPIKNLEYMCFITTKKSVVMKHIHQIV